MMVGHLFQGVKNNAESIAEPTAGQPDQEGGCHALQQRLYGDQHHPAHQDIYHQRELLHFAQREDLEVDASNGQNPDHAEEGPAPAPAHHSERHGRVGAGDEQKDRAVVQDAKKTFDLRLRKGVVQRRSQIKRDEGSAVNAEGDYLPGVAAPGSENHEDDQRRDAEADSRAVGNAVGDLLAEALPGTERDPI